MDNNETPIETFHIGHAIKAELARQGRSITWLARQIGYTRENLYKIMRREWIYTDVLFKICDALDYDFFKAGSDWRKSPSYPKAVNQTDNL
ncbi:MAG: helix-turn-helix domain-containing protein [Bacteroidales bacterium]|nr:helix-turn-helix domain-containing protein [Bacteroidales bacterium]